MIKNKILSLIVVTIMVSMAIGGCAPKAIETPEVVATEAPAVATAEPVTPVEPVELVIWQHSNQLFLEANEAAVKAFQETHPNVTIKIETFEYDALIQAIQTSMPAGTEADIIQMFGGWVCSYAEGGRLAEVPADIMTVEQAKDLYFAATISGNICGEKLYGLPQEFNIGYGGVFINDDMFTAAGIPLPVDWKNDWNNVIADAKKLTVVKDGAISIPGFHFLAGDNVFNLVFAGILQRGGSYFTADGTQLDFNTPEAKATLEWMMSFVDAGVVDPVIHNAPQSWPDEAIFASLAAMGYYGPHVYPAGIRDYPDLNFEYVGHPYFGDKPVFAAESGWTKVVSVNSKNQDIAWEFIKFNNADPEQAKAWNLHTSTLAGLKSVADDPAFAESAPQFKALIPILQYGQPVGPIPDRDKLANLMYETVVNYLQGNITVDEALNTMTVQGNEFYQQ